MEIKEPAAIFSEAGLKIFIEAIQEAERTKIQPSENDNEIEKLIKEHKAYKESEPSSRLDTVTEFLNDFFADGEIKTTEAIVNYLNSISDTTYTLRSMASTMRGVMNRNPQIKKLSAKHYQLQTEVNNEEVAEHEE